MRTLKKAFSILIFLFTFQTLISCLFRCDDPKSYAVSYESVEITPLDSSGPSTLISDSALHTNAFALRINFVTDQIEIDDYRISSAIGFNTASALEKCEDAYFQYENNVSAIEIIRIDEDELETNITTSFSGYDYYGNEITVVETVEVLNSDSGYPYYKSDFVNVELRHYKDLPQSFKLRVNVILESGDILTKETNTLYFIN